MSLGCFEFDKAYGATNSLGFGCHYYEDFPDDCEAYDTDIFIARSMCCACIETGKW